MSIWGLADSQAASDITELLNRHNVPAQDSAINQYLRDVVGNKLDSRDGTSLVALNNRLLDFFCIITGISPGGNSSNKFVLDSNASSVDGAYDPGQINIIGGTGAGQSRQIWDYDGTTKTAYLNRDWKVTPDETSHYVIKYNPGDGHVNEGLAQGGGANTITLNTLASAQNNIYLGQCIFIVAGTGADQARMVIGYNGGTKVATVDANWIIQPDNTSVYAMRPYPGFVHGAATANGSANILLRDIIGNKNDKSLSTPGSDSLYGIAGFMAYYHVHSPSLIYPQLAAPITVTAGVGAWTEGGKVQIIGAGVKANAYDVHFVNLGTISQVDDYEIRLYTGAAAAEVFWGAASFTRDTNQMRAAYVPIQGPPVPAGTRLSATLASGNGNNSCDVKVYTHEYPS